MRFTGWVRAIEPLYVTLTLFLSACLVVTSTTPFPARTPYMADAAASLRKEIDSMSAGLMASIGPLNTVDEDQRGIVVEGSYASDIDAGIVGSRLSRGLVGLDTRIQTGQGR